MEARKHIVILAAGDFPTHPVPLRVLREADFVVCCDSAYREWKVESGKWRVESGKWKVESGVRSQPFVVIGDGDSLPAADKAALGPRWVQVDEQDYNDLHKAMAYIMNGDRRAENGELAIAGHSPFSVLRSPFSVSILGATGRREDHTLGNISYLATFMEEYPGLEVEMLTDHGRFACMQGSRVFDSFRGQQVSIFSLSPDVPVSAEGLKYPLRGRCLRLWWEATLNEALSDHFSLAGGTLLVFRTHEAK